MANFKCDQCGKVRWQKGNRPEYKTHFCSRECHHQHNRENPRTTLKERFLKGIKINPETGCWEWQRSRHKFGYGWIYDHATKTRETTHTVAWRIFRGPIPDGLSVLHDCDNPPCCNPDHLHLGTNANNHEDMVARGRSTIGERNPRAKLTADDVREIRLIAATSTLSQGEVGMLFGVSGEAVCHILSGRRWKSVT